RQHCRGPRESGLPDRVSRARPHIERCRGRRATRPGRLTNPESLRRAATGLSMEEGKRKKPGGTLASAADLNEVVEPAPQVTVSETPPPAARGVAPGVVIALVALALAAGFLLGWGVR